MPDQSETIGFLADPALHGGAEPHRADTHISHLFIGPTRVFKLKRAISTNFLDFSTPAKRAAMCRRELEVNDAARALYRAVRAVTRAPDGTLALDGAGTPIDWVVEMAPFDAGSEFDSLAGRGALSVAQVERLADGVAAMHEAAPRILRCDEAAHQIDRIAQIADALCDRTAAGSVASAVTRWREAVLAERARHEGLIDRRARHGFLRRVHGDLHLGNVCLLDGVPTPFDAMEFNEDIATTDVLYDAAFLAMDLVRHSLPGHAAAFTSRYLGVTRDHGGLALLPLFMSMRATVRAIPLAGEDDSRAEELLSDALSLLKQDTRPRLIAIGGASGTGKTTLARRLAARLKAAPFPLILRSDVTRKRLFGRLPEEALPPEGYAPAVSATLHHRLRRDADRALGAGFTTIVDATFLRDAERRAMEELAQRASCAFTGLWLTGDAAILKERVAARVGDASDATPAIVAQQLATAPDARGWLHLDAGDSLDALAAAALVAVGHGAV